MNARVGRVSWVVKAAKRRFEFVRGKTKLRLERNPYERAQTKK